MGRRGKQAKQDSDTVRVGEPVRPEVPPEGQDASEVTALVRRHLRFGWGSLLVFVALGLFLETLHGFKIGWYVDLSDTTRRHMWTLAHAHGTLLAVLNLILALTIRFFPTWSHRPRSIASACLLSAAILLPVGFFLGGLFTHGGDPGLGIVLVPVGGIMLIIAVFVAARG